MYTTRNDGFADTGIVDRGYHYTISYLKTLTVNIVDENNNILSPEEAHGYVTPSFGRYQQGTVVSVKAFLIQITVLYDGQEPMMIPRPVIQRTLLLVIP